MRHFSYSSPIFSPIRLSQLDVTGLCGFVATAGLRRLYHHARNTRGNEWHYLKHFCSDMNSLLTGKNTGNFVIIDASICALLGGNPRPEPIPSHPAHFEYTSEQGITGN